jgi:hypothetical protein
VPRGGGDRDGADHGFRVGGWAVPRVGDDTALCLNVLPR